MVSGHLKNEITFSICEEGSETPLPDTAGKIERWRLWLLLFDRFGGHWDARADVQRRVVEIFRRRLEAC